MSSQPHAGYRRLSPLTPLARSGILVAAAAASMWDDALRGDLGPLGWGVLGLLAAGGIYGAAAWALTKYWIEADELRVDTGIINRQSRRIRINRLQGIDVVQPFVARLLGLAELRMDVAGGSAREGSLAFLRLRDAHELRDVLLARRRSVQPGVDAPLQAGATGSAAVPGGEYAGPLSPDRAARPLARVDLGMLVLSTLLLPETILPVIVGALFLAGALVLGEWAPVTGVVPVVGGFLLVQLRKLSGYYDMTVSETPAGLQVRRGLFSLNAQTIALSRVQGVVVGEPVLWRRRGWARLDVSIAGYASSGDNEGPSASTLLPVGRRDDVLALAEHVLGNVDLRDGLVLTRPPRRARWVSPFGWRFAGVGVSRSLVVSREGWVTRRTLLVPHARVQSLRLTQGPVQRRLGLADVHVDSPPGPVRLRARDRATGDARSLLEAEVERSRSARLESRQVLLMPVSGAQELQVDIPGADHPREVT